VQPGGGGEGEGLEVPQGSIKKDNY
jgi:hypothetical protein